MNFRTSHLVFASLLAASSASYAQTTGSSQVQAPAPLSPSTLTTTIQAAERTQNSDALLLTYGTAVTDPLLARVAIGQLLTSYYQLRNQAQTADQATQAVAEATLRFLVLQSAQNQVIIQQNQQLLQQNAQLIEIMASQQPAATQATGRQ